MKIMLDDTELQHTGSSISMPNGQTLEAASATGKYCRNYDEVVAFLTDSRSVLDSLAEHGEHHLRRKLYSILGHRRVILPWITAHCGFQGNAHAIRLAKQGATMEQEERPITLKQKKKTKNETIKNRFRANKIPDDYHTLYRAGQDTLIRQRTGHISFNSHMHRRINLVPSPLCTCGTEDQTTEHILQRCTSYQHLREQILRRNIIVPESVWEERRTREDSWLHSAGGLIRVIK